MPTRDLFLAAAGALLLVGVAWTQQPSNPATPKPAAPPPAKPAADSLETLMADALKHNPNIQEASANVRAAETKLNKIKNEVMVEIASVHKILTQAREVQSKVEIQHDFRKKLADKGVSQLELTQSEIEVAKVRSTVAEVEANLMKLVGRVPSKSEQGAAAPATNGYFRTHAIGPTGQWLYSGTYQDLQPFVNQPYNLNRNMLVVPDANLQLWDVSPQYLYLNQAVKPAATSQPSIADRLKAVMQKPVKIDKEFKGSARAALDFLKERGLKDVPVRMFAGRIHAFDDAVELMAGELPMSAWLAVIQDSVPDLRFIVREYGLLVTTNDRVPPDGMLLGDFVRRANAQESKPKPAESKKEEKKEEKKQ